LSFFPAGLQGMTGMGMQEEGTNTGTGPAIFQFIGLAGELQLPKAGMFSMGTKSNCMPMGFVFAFMAIPIGSTTMSFGPDPKEHFNLAPMHTHFGISPCFYSLDESWRPKGEPAHPGTIKDRNPTRNDQFGLRSGLRIHSGWS
jgi:hypothetical protein